MLTKRPTEFDTDLRPGVERAEPRKYPMSHKRLLERAKRDLDAHISRERAVGKLYRAHYRERDAFMNTWQLRNGQ